MTITIPGQPRPLQRARAVSRGKFAAVVDTSDNRVNKATIGLYAKMAMNGSHLLEGPLKMDIEFRLKKPASKIRKQSTPYPHPDGKPDIDNLVKLVMDGLNGIVYVDDAQVVGLTVRKVWARPSGPETVIEIGGMG